MFHDDCQADHGEDADAGAGHFLDGFAEDPFPAPCCVEALFLIDEEADQAGVKQDCAGMGEDWDLAAVPSRCNVSGSWW